MGKWAVTENIPEHLAPFIVKQDPALYTPIDHASWRYILRVSRAFFAHSAHKKYLNGLEETGISIDRIPLVSEIDECLRRFGWRAVAVSGFIPPAAFMEFQSLGILPVACDMRSLDHLAYTPAPDIVHEAAGHAPIIADPEYADYLRNYGEVSRKAISSDKDLLVYEAIRNLSEVKENPHSTWAEVQAAQTRLDQAVAAVDFLSEAALLARMNWWTVEYGLVGTMDNPKIYGAGLLSSVGESFHCLRDQVQKTPFSIDCIETDYDITRPQPQLFVTPDFASLTRVLEEFAQTMAFRRGGRAGLEKALQAKTPTTAVLDSGIQVGGLLAEFLGDQAGAPCYLSFRGPTQLAYRDHQLDGHGANYHREGFGSPVGKLKGLGKSPAALTEQDLLALGFSPGKMARLEFESGVVVVGILEGFVRKEGLLLVLVFNSCTVTLGERILFRPEWGTYDMACGSEVISVFGGTPDRGAYLRETGGLTQKPAFQKTNLTPENRELNGHYQRVRELRELAQREPSKLSIVKAGLSEVHVRLNAQHPDDWLLRLELLELNRTLNLMAPWEEPVRNELTQLSKRSPQTQELIARGTQILSLSV